MILLTDKLSFWVEEIKQFSAMTIAKHFQEVQPDMPPSNQLVAEGLGVTKGLRDASVLI
jgi:hypothetical protein